MSYVKDIEEFLRLLKEVDLYQPLKDLFTAKGYIVRITGGPHERGKDLIASKEDEYNLLINVKRGDIDKEKWKNDVHPSLDSLMRRSLNYTGIEESLPKKPLLIFSGTMTPSVAQELDDFNKYYKCKGDPEVEVWDIAKLASEFNKHLLSTDIIKDSFLEDLKRLVLSITNESIDHMQCFNLVDNYLDLDQKKFVAFRLSVLYIRRRSEIKQNPYSFFYFIEYALVKVWEKIFLCNNFSLIAKFDILHEIYLDSLEEWAISMDTNFNKELGLFEANSDSSLEIVFYVLRTFDSIRRVAYLAYVKFLNDQNDDVEKQICRLMKIISNNKSATTPLCEFNYNDIGLALWILYLTKQHDYATNWIWELIEFIVNQHNLGYELMPLGSKFETVFEILFKNLKPRSDIKSHILFLLFEFLILYNMQDAYEIFRRILNLRIVFCELVAPIDESKIYERDVALSFAETKIKAPLEITWPLFKKNHPNRILYLHKNRKYTPITHNRPFLLILLGNIYRDRYFPEIWRSKYL